MLRFIEQAVKFSVLNLANRSGRTRRLSATGYVEWVLGDLRPKTAIHQFREGDVQHMVASAFGPRRAHALLGRLPLAAWPRRATCSPPGMPRCSTSRFPRRPASEPRGRLPYDLPARSGESASLYQHCVRAIERGAGVGEHGLPLIGSGDWNDGMDQVGAKGRGESVWLAVESLLGLRLEGDKLRLAPCLPASWAGFKLRYRYRDTL